MGVQIRVAGTAVAVAEYGRDQATDVDLPDPVGNVRDGRGGLVVRVSYVMILVDGLILDRVVIS